MTSLPTDLTREAVDERAADHARNLWESLPARGGPSAADRDARLILRDIVSGLCDENVLTATLTKRVPEVVSRLPSDVRDLITPDMVGEEVSRQLEYRNGWAKARDAEADAKREQAAQRKAEKRPVRPVEPVRSPDKVNGGRPGVTPPVGVREGYRHASLISYVASLVARGGDEREVTETLLYINKTWKPPLPESEVRREVKTAFKGAVKKGWEPHPEDDPVLRDAKPLGTSSVTSSAPQEVHLRMTALAVQPTNSDDWHVRDLIRPASIVVLGSVEGLGKSNIRRELAIEAGSGRGTFLGHYPITAPFRVLLIDEDNGEPEEWRGEETMLKGLGVGRTELGNYYATTHFIGVDLYSDEGKGRLVSAIEQHHPDLTVLDTATIMTREEWGEAFKQAFAFLRHLTYTTGTAFLVVVHLVKPPRTGGRGQNTSTRALTDVMGQWTRHADAVVIMSRLNEDGTRARIAVRKRVPNVSFIVGQQDGRWAKVADDDGLAREDPTLVLIRDGIDTAKGLVAERAKGREPTEADEKAIKRVVRGLRDGGFLTDEYPYRLSPEGVAAVSLDDDDDPF